MTPAFYRAGNATWGGSIIFAPEDGLWHMLLAYMEGSCGLNAWQDNSAIYHATSASGSPIGPFVNESRVLPYFSHNPVITHAPDGAYLVWHIGCGDKKASYNPNCTNGTTPPPPPPPPVKIMNGGQCLISAGTFPCWSGGTGEVCPAVMGSCADPTAAWRIEGSNLVNAVSGARANIDCNHCLTGTIAKLFGTAGSDFSVSGGKIVASGCAGMCLSTGAGGAGIKPCGGGGEPWLATQVQLAPCGSAGTTGWTTAPVEAAERAAPRRRAAASVASGGGGISPYPAPCTDTNVLVSTTGIWGPYVQTGILNGTHHAPLYETDNPSPIHFANGTTWIMARSWHPPGPTTTPIGIARSDFASWNSSYTLLPETIPQFPSARNRTLAYIPLEDPCMYIDELGNFHALFHNMGGCSAVGCHAFSQDGFTWFLASSPAYTTTVFSANGSNTTVARRERPHLVFNQAGQPAFLSNGVQATWADDHTFTQVQQINVPWP